MFQAMHCKEMPEIGGVTPTRVDAAISIERGHKKGQGDAESANAGDQQGQGQ
jgi:hypothetical protein